MKRIEISKYRFTYVFLACIFIIAFCCYFMTSIMSISPIYFTTLLGIYLLARQFYYKESDCISIAVYFSVFLYSLTYLIDCFALQGDLHSALVSFFFGLYYIFVDLVLSQIDEKDKIQKIVKVYFIFFCIYYLFDLLLRVKAMQNAVVPEWMKVNPILKFYLIKQGGLNGDSNTLGTFCVALFSILFFAYHKTIISKKYLIISFLMTFFTASRAAIVSCIALVIFWKFFYKQNKIVKLFMILFGLIFSFLVFTLFLHDSSFLTKLDIFEKIITYVKENNIKTFLFGLGPNNSYIAVGRYAHNIWSIMILEYGLIGLLTYIIMMIMVMADTGKYFFVVAIPYFLVSLSFTPIFLQFLFVSFALVKHITRILPKEERVVVKKKNKTIGYIFKYNMV